MTKSEDEWRVLQERQEQLGAHCLLANWTLKNASRVQAGANRFLRFTPQAWNEAKRPRALEPKNGGTKPAVILLDAIKNWRNEPGGLTLELPRRLAWVMIAARRPHE